MSIWRAIVLGIIQGLTEFLPISSSGHLILVRELLGWEFGPADIEKTFDVALHVGTFVGIAAYFLMDIGRLMKGAVAAVGRRSLEAHPYSRLAAYIVVATIPAALVGLTAEEFIEGRLGAPLVVAVMLVIFGVLMGWADQVGRRARDMSCLRWKDVVIIGVAQALALSPGTSRSGVTITAGLFLGLKRESAARFSFLISLPAIAGAAVYKAAKLVSAGLPEGLVIPMLAGTLAAGLSGLFAVAWLLRFLQSHSLRLFVYYRLAAGLGLLAYFLLRGAGGSA